MSGGRAPRRPTPSEGYQLATRAFAVTIIGFGLAICAITLARGGGPTSLGLLMGLAFVGIGSGRLYLSLRQ